MKTNFTFLMQSFAIVFILFFATIFSSAQVVDVATNLQGPTDMVIDGDDMYVSEYGSGRILKIDLTQTPPFTPVEIANGLIDCSCSGLALKGNDLYISQSSSISKIDLTQTPPIAATVVVTNLSTPIKLIFNGDNLFFPENGDGKISMIDITQSSPTVVDVVTGLSPPYGIALIGDELFYSEGGKISKVDITASFPISNITEVVSALSIPTGIFKSGDDLFIGEFGTDKISKIDLTASFPTTATEVLSDIIDPLQFALYGNELYFTHGGNTISKLEIMVSNNNPTPLALEVFPNPTSGMITLEGISLDRLEVIDIYGRILFSENRPDSNLDISDFPNGLYFLKMTVGEQEVTKHIVKRQ